jgi:tRNA (cytidine/uridine-2'-O-)-methyltransferase
MLHVVLHRPEIPQNTGNIGRMCAIARARLHLVHPLGFAITDAHLRRSGMDYWRSLDVCHHGDWAAFTASGARPPGRLWLLSTRAGRTIWEAAFAEGDGLVFGNESAGAPDWLRAEIGPAWCVRIPQFDPALRSLNLSTAAGIATYEALRQCAVARG